MSSNEVGLRCGRCGRPTQAAAWIGVYPIGPTCAKAMGLTGKSKAKRRAGVVRLAGERVKGAKVARDNKTRDLFDENA